MNKNIILIEPDITLKEAAKIMSKNNIGSLAVVKERNIEGILTERDILKNIEFLNKKISSIMTKNIISIDIDQHIENAAALMSQNKIKKLFVTEGEKLVGIITATDILAHSDYLNDNWLF